MLRPKTLAVLRYLLDHAGHIVSAADLRAAVWPGIVVGDGVLRNCIHELRVALDDERETPHFIETLPHKGYRLIAPLSTSQPVQSSEFKVQSSQSPIRIPQ
jgi:DNA-binding winged helix-turn-helix (wHTH) protein